MDKAPHDDRPLAEQFDLEAWQADRAEWLRERPGKLVWANRRDHGEPPFKPDADTMRRFEEDSHLVLRACAYWRQEAECRDHWWECEMPVEHFTSLGRALVSFADRNGIHCGHAITKFADRSQSLVYLTDPPDAGGSKEAGFSMYSMYKAAIDDLNRVVDWARISAGKPEEEITDSDYGENYNRDKWLTDMRSSMTLAELEQRLSDDCGTTGWTPIGVHGIRNAISKFCAMTGRDLPQGRAGRPRRKPVD